MPWKNINCDLWHELFHHIESKSIILELCWVPSHCLEDDDEYLKYKPTLLSMVHNHIADDLADHAVKQCELSLDIALPIIY